MMKIILNKSYGGISFESAQLRRDPGLIEMVESGRFTGRTKPGAFGGVKEELVVVEIPDGVTDFAVLNYDGMEYVYYVQYGVCWFVPSCDLCKIVLENAGVIRAKIV